MAIKVNSSKIDFLCIIPVIFSSMPKNCNYAAYSFLQGLYDLHLIKIVNRVQYNAEPPEIRPGVKIVYYRGAPCEPNPVDTSQEKICKQGSRTKQGCYRGAVFDVKA